MSIHQHTFAEHIQLFTRRAEAGDPVRPALALFFVVLMLMLIGLLIQASHAATSCEPAAFGKELFTQLAFRGTGLALLLCAARIGPQGLRRFLPALTLLGLALLVLVFIPPLGRPINGSHRWLRYGSLSFQPSELARVLLILWIADRCVRLGPLAANLRRGVLPILLMSLTFFGLILLETDLGAALLLLMCALGTLWVGGARPIHVASSLLAVGGGALAATYALIPYIRDRVETWLGRSDNAQVEGALDALSAGGFLGTGLTHGVYRRLGVPYLESDFVLAQVGEELGLLGLLIVIGLWLAFAWYSLQLVASIEDRYGALCSFGLLVSTAMTAMLHIQVAAGLAPPKGVTLPFISDGGTALLVASLAVGLSIGAARCQERRSAVLSVST